MHDTDDASPFQKQDNNATKLAKNLYLASAVLFAVEFVAAACAAIIG